MDPKTFESNINKFLYRLILAVNAGIEGTLNGENIYFAMQKHADLDLVVEKKGEKSKIPLKKTYCTISTEVKNIGLQKMLQLDVNKDVNLTAFERQTIEGKHQDAKARDFAVARAQEKK